MFDFAGMDLAAVASAAGLGGSAVAGIAAAIFFKGFLMRILSQVIVTAILTGIGFIALLQVLGFAIVPKDDVAPAVAARSADGVVTPQFDVSPAATPPEAIQAEAEGKKVYYVQSPFRKKG